MKMNVCGYLKYRDAKSGVYVIRNLINKNFYLGSTTCDKRRWYTHKLELRNQRHDNIRLQRAWNKYGAENFEFELICEVDAIVALQMEDRLLEKFFGQKYCYNLNRSAVMSGLGRIWTDKMRITASEGQRGRKLTENEKNKLLRPPLSSDELLKRQKVNMAKARQVVALMSEEEYSDHLRKRGLAISQSKMGHLVSVDTRQKISKSLKGKPWSKARLAAQQKK